MENKIKKAAFSLKDYRFVVVEIYYKSAPENSKELSIEFDPKGVYSTLSEIFTLTIDFYAYEEDKGKSKSFIHTAIVAEFDFENTSSLDDIPAYFYKNSIAIIYPYIRAFVSNLSVQSNCGSFILPTLNLSMLESTLKENTVSK